MPLQFALAKLHQVVRKDKSQQRIQVVPVILNKVVSLQVVVDVMANRRKSN
jgi:hypothetical protein